NTAALQRLCSWPERPACSRTPANSASLELDRQQVEEGEYYAPRQAPDRAGHIPILGIGEVGINQQAGENLALEAGHADPRALIDKPLELAERMLLGHRRRMKMGRVRKGHLPADAAKGKNAQKRECGRQHQTGDPD